MTKLEYTLSKIDRDFLDEELFEKALNIASFRESGSNGIGTLSEKTVHAVLKKYYVPDEHCHEINIVKKYVADACVDGEIYEIQSKSFYTMKDKLDMFLKEHEVTIIYPVAVNKYIRYIDPETGEIYEKRKSTKKGGLLDIVPELYGIKDYLKNKKLHFIICFIEMEEYKILDGWSKDKKKGATKADRIPTKIIGEFRIDKRRDFLNLLPCFRDGKKIRNSEFPREFTTKDICNHTGYHISYAQYLMNILCFLGLTENTGKSGRLNIYRLK